MNSEQLNNTEFEKALSDYFYLIDHDYPERGALKLVGDRYKLRSELRTILYRGITSSFTAYSRKQRLIEKPSDNLVIDGYNVLFTILNYRLGRFVFISNDDICRDAGSLFGKIRNENMFTECASILTSFLPLFENIHILIYLDSPVSFSIKHKQLLIDLLKKNNITGQVEVVYSADYAIKQHAKCTIASSDSALIDACTNSIIDLPRQIIEKKYNVSLFNIQLKLFEILYRK